LDVKAHPNADEPIKEEGKGGRKKKFAGILDMPRTSHCSTSLAGKRFKKKEERGKKKNYPTVQLEPNLSVRPLRDNSLF